MIPKVFSSCPFNWNSWKDTIECLESVFLTAHGNYQVVVVDNGSTNGSVEKIRAWADRKSIHAGPVAAALYVEAAADREATGRGEKKRCSG